MPAVIPGPPAAISFDFWHTLVAEPGGVLAALRREAVVRTLIEHKVDVEEDVLDAHLAAAQALQAEGVIEVGQVAPRAPKATASRGR